MSALLDVQGLTAHYGDFQALFGVDLHLDAGEAMAIIGANGAGKTTLMRAITGVARVTGGAVKLAGAEITRLPAPAWRPTIFPAAASPWCPKGGGCFPA